MYIYIQIQNGSKDRVRKFSVAKYAHSLMEWRLPFYFLTFFLLLADDDDDDADAPPSPTKATFHYTCISNVAFILRPQRVAQIKNGKKESRVKATEPYQMGFYVAFV